MGQVFLRVPRFLPVSIILAVLHTHHLLKTYYYYYYKDKRAKPGNFESHVPMDVGDYWPAEQFHVVSYSVSTRSWRFPVPGVHKSRPWRWNFVRWRLVFVDPHCGTCWKSLRILRWLLECWKICASLSYTRFNHSPLSCLVDTTCGRRVSVTVIVSVSVTARIEARRYAEVLYHRMKASLPCVAFTYSSAASSIRKQLRRKGCCGQTFKHPLLPLVNFPCILLISVTQK